MNHAIDSSHCFPVGDSPAIKVAIIYEDFASGVRAKHFAERLAGRLEVPCSIPESFWRCDLLECPAIAEEASRTAADCDYLLVSLRGDHVLPCATRRWIEAQLDRAGGRGSGLIALIASGGELWRAGEDTRQRLRTLCAVKGVPFFSHVQSPPVERGAADNFDRFEAKEHEMWERRSLHLA